MKRKPFAGIYRCRSCRQEGARYFFDSQPTETKCGRCDGTAKLVREIASSQMPGAANEDRKKRRRPRSVPAGD